MRTVLTAAVLAATAALVATPDAPAPARLVATNLTRAEIRSLPMLARPDRPIHFYGNAVRRRHRAMTAPQTPARPAPAR